MRDPLEQRDPLVFRDLLDPLGLLALWEIPARGVSPGRLVYLELMVSRGLLVPPSCCLSVSARAEEIRDLQCRHRKLKQRPSCLRPGWR